MEARPQARESPCGRSLRAEAEGKSVADSRFLYHAAVASEAHERRGGLSGHMLHPCCEMQPARCMQHAYLLHPKRIQARLVGQCVGAPVPLLSQKGGEQRAEVRTDCTPRVMVDATAASCFRSIGIDMRRWLRRGENPRMGSACDGWGMTSGEGRKSIADRVGRFVARIPREDLPPPISPD